MLSSIAQKLRKFERNADKYAVNVYHLGDEKELTYGYIMDEDVDRSYREDLSEKEREYRDFQNRQRSIRRSKKKLRYKIMAGGLSYMWSLTYEKNMRDRDEVWKHWRYFREKLERRRGKKLDYVVVVEEQDRGALHLHFATNEFIEHDVVEECWGQGFVFVSALGLSVKNDVQKVAGYLAKYLEKDMMFSGEDKRRFSVSKGIEVKKTEYRVKELSMVERILRKVLSRVGAYEIADDGSRGWFASWGESSGDNVEDAGQGFFPALRLHTAPLSPF